MRRGGEEEMRRGGEEDRRRVEMSGKSGRSRSGNRDNIYRRRV